MTVNLRQRVKKVFMCCILMGTLCTGVTPIFADNTYVYDEADIIDEATEEYLEELNDETLSEYNNSPAIYIRVIKALPDDLTLKDYIQNNVNAMSKDHDTTFDFLFVYSIKDKQYGTYTGDGYSDSSYYSKLQEIFDTPYYSGLSTGGYNEKDITNASIYAMLQKAADVLKDVEESNYEYQYNESDYTYGDKKESFFHLSEESVQKITNIGIGAVVICLLLLLIKFATSKKGKEILIRPFKWFAVQICLSQYSDYIPYMNDTWSGLTKYFMTKMKDISVFDLVSNFSYYLYKKYTENAAALIAKEEVCSNYEDKYMNMFF